MTWQVEIDRKVDRVLFRLPFRVRKTLFALISEIELKGPVRGNWPNFGKLSGNHYHCHLKKGKPTYVAVWEVINKDIKLVEVIYAGTHEKAPY